VWLTGRIAARRRLGRVPRLSVTPGREPRAVSFYLAPTVR
jgi:hypothetical protein